jgi:hypothetical protein
MATAGIPLYFRRDRKKTALYFRFRADPAIEAPTEIFLPSQYFGGNPGVSPAITVRRKGEGGKNMETGSLRTEYVREDQRLFVYNDGYGGEAEVSVS